MFKTHSYELLQLMTIVALTLTGCTWTKGCDERVFTHTKGQSIWRNRPKTIIALGCCQSHTYTMLNFIKPFLMLLREQTVAIFVNCLNTKGFLLSKGMQLGECSGAQGRHRSLGL